jgi:hypothetical protein
MHLRLAGNFVSYYRTLVLVVMEAEETVFSVGVWVSTRWLSTVGNRFASFMQFIKYFNPFSCDVDSLYVNIKCAGVCENCDLHGISGELRTSHK